MVSLDIFKSLDREEYETNEGRIRNVKELNEQINEITINHASEELIDLFRQITVPVSKINTIPEVLEEYLVQRRLLTAEDPITGTRITLPPPPHMTPFLEENNRKLSFPPRFGEHNQEIYGKLLGYSQEDLESFKKEKII